MLLACYVLSYERKLFKLVVHISINMKAKIICYDLEGLSASKRRLLYKKLYGYKDHSHHGKYIYDRPGLLQEYEAEKIIDAVILVRNDEGAKKIIDLLDKYGAKKTIFEVSKEIKL